MFVAIDNEDMDAFEVEDWINRTRDASEGKRISPEFAMEILGKTNFYGHIKKVLKNIKEKNKTKEELLLYKDFVLSCVDGREMSPQALTMLQELADVCEVRDEFDELKNKEPKVYDRDDCYKVVIVRTEEEFYELGGENLRIFFDADKVYLSSCEFNHVKSLKFREGAKVNLSEAKNLPKDLDVSMCSKVDLGNCDLKGLDLKFREGAKVNLSGAENLPKDLDVSMCSEVKLTGCDLEGLDLNFREGAKVDLSGAKNLPKELDLSMCSEVDMWYCDLTGVEKIKFREGAKVNLNNAEKLPKELDLSMCSEVNLCDCDLSGVEKIKFREGAEVNLNNAEKLPKDLDVSMCSKVELIGCDLEGLELKFREGAVVDLKGAMNLPKELDLSMCSRIYLGWCNLRGVEKIKFKNKAQEEEFMKEAKNFGGKVFYVEDESGKHLMNGNGGMEISNF